MKRITLAVLSTLAILSGCASVDEPVVGDYGPFPARWQAEIDSYLENNLIDPDSRRVRFDSGPVATRTPGKARFGYGVCAWVNARNRLGGYTGAKQVFFLFQQGRLVEAGLGYPASVNEYYCSGFQKYAAPR